MGKFLQGLHSSRKSRSGFTLIELAIVLAITSLLAAGLWRMMATGNSQLRDQAAADQHKALLNAVRGYLASTEGYNNVIAATAPLQFNLPLPPAATGCAAPYANTHFCDYLPIGFRDDTTNSYNQTYGIQVLRELDGGGTIVGYSFMIKTMAGDVIPDTSGGRISSMIGNDGGFVYTSDVCGGAGAMACGAYGSWAAAPVADYAFGGVAGGQIASRTFVGLNASLNTPWLARQVIPGDAAFDFNTMGTNLFLNGNSFFGGDSAGNPGGAISMNSPDIAVEPEGTTLVRITGCGITTDPLNPLPLVPVDGNCGGHGIDALEVHGYVGIDGMLKTASLYAGRLVYDSAAQYSDIRLKRDLVRVDNALEKISSINGYSFFFKDSDRKRYGVVAQEVEKVFPELVSDMGDGYKGVDYVGLIGPLVEAVKDLRTQNEALVAKVEALERQNKKRQNAEKKK